MKMERRHIAGEDTLALILYCDDCRRQIVVSFSEVKTTHPIECTCCKHSRFLSYREYIDIQDRFSPLLLEFSIRKLSNG